MDAASLLLDAFLAPWRLLLASPGAVAAQLQAAGQAAAAGGGSSDKGRQLLEEVKALAVTLSEAVAAVEGGGGNGRAESAAAEAPAKRLRSSWAQLPPPRDRVRTNPDLMGHIDSYLEGPASHDTLLALMATCREWRGRDRAPRFWRPVLQARLPVLAARLRPTQDPYEAFRERARAVVQRQVILEGNWTGGLDVEFQFWDVRTGAHLFSIAGPASTDEWSTGGRVHSLSVDRRGAVEVKGQRLRVARADLNEQDLFKGIAARVSLRCQRTGRSAILWESGSEAVWGLYPFQYPEDPPQGEPLLLHVLKTTTAALQCGEMIMPDVDLLLVTDWPGEEDEDGSITYIYDIMGMQFGGPPVKLTFTDNTYIEVGRFIRAVLEKGSG